jgi:heme-degrading monooxygenase HmoA
MHARVTTLQGDPDRADDVAARLRSDDVPGFEQLDGFKGMTMMVDRDSGKMIALTFWESAEALQASEEAVKDARSRAAERGGASTPQVERYEVLFDTMA